MTAKLADLAGGLSKSIGDGEAVQRVNRAPVLNVSLDSKLFALYPKVSKGGLTFKPIPKTKHFDFPSVSFCERKL